MNKFSWVFLIVTFVAFATSSCEPSLSPVSDPEIPTRSSVPRTFTPTSFSPTTTSIPPTFTMAPPSPVPTLVPSTPTSTSTPTNMPTSTLASPLPTQTQEPQLRTYNGYEFMLISNPQDNSKTDISIKNLKTGEQELYITLPDIDVRHYHPCEYHNGNLYVIKKIRCDGHPEVEWTSELWRYDADEKSTKLHTAKDIDFRVSPNERYLAVREENLVFLGSQGNPLQGITIKELSSHEDELHGPLIVRIHLLKWSDNSNQFWGALQAGPSPQTIYRVEVPLWQKVVYDISELHIPVEYDLNANTGKLVYSDYPQIYDVTSLEEFEKSQRAVILFIYDLNSRDIQNIQIVDTSVAAKFYPKWIDDVTVEYDSPEEENRITFTTD